MSFDNRIFGNERKYVEEVLSTSFASSSGAKMMTRLEQAFSERFEQNLRYLLLTACNNARCLGGARYWRGGRGHCSTVNDVSYDICGSPVTQRLSLLMLIRHISD